MNWKARSATLAAVLAFVVSAAACGGSPSGSTASSSPKGTITIGGFKFSEGSVLAELYGQALEHDGYSVQYKLNLGSRHELKAALASLGQDGQPA